MSEFSDFKKRFQSHFEEMAKDANCLYEVAVDKDELWNLYLDSFPAGTNEIYRERREYDCSCCRHFIKTIGNAVALKDNAIITLWDFDTSSSTFQPVVDALSTYIKNRHITDIFVSKESTVGTNENHEELPNGAITKWEHLYLKLPNKFVDRSSRSAGDIKGEFRDTRNVFKRSLDEISEDSIMTVLELISQNSLYRGSEWKGVLTEFLKHKKQYSKITAEIAKENYCWEQARIAGAVIGRIRNHSIGTLLVNISDGMDLDTAVSKYEVIVAPANYKRPNAIFTKKMLADAQKTISDLGYMDSLRRRHATLDDITVNNILFSNRDAAKRIAKDDIFAEMANDVSVNPKSFSKVEEIGIDAFIKNVLPTASELSVLFENRHAQNMVSLIAPEVSDSKTMFKWNNGFSWAYAGNIADSDIKSNVKSAGGKVDGVLRFSIQWNDKERNPNDFDAHCTQPNGADIYFGRKQGYTGGALDVDIIRPTSGVPAVENITWASKGSLVEGVYKFKVHNYCARGGRTGFKAEIEFDGELYSFEYPSPLRDGQYVSVADVFYSKKSGFSIVPKLSEKHSAISREVWGVTTNQFVPVSVVMYSPNYWDEQKGIGNKHYFFMMKDCVNPEQPNAFYNEFLKEDLLKHKRVLEALGGKLAVEAAPDQLSGIGFSETKRNDIIVKVKGSIERTLKVKF